jgi:hypothetical protein
MTALDCSIPIRQVVGTQSLSIVGVRDGTFGYIESLVDKFDAFGFFDAPNLKMPLARFLVDRYVRWQRDFELLNRSRSRGRSSSMLKSQSGS